MLIGRRWVWEHGFSRRRRRRRHAKSDKRVKAKKRVSLVPHTHTHLTAACSRFGPEVSREFVFSCCDIYLILCDYLIYSEENGSEGNGKKM